MFIDEFILNLVDDMLNPVTEWLIGQSIKWLEFRSGDTPVNYIDWLTDWLINKFHWFIFQSHDQWTIDWRITRHYHTWTEIIFNEWTDDMLLYRMHVKLNELI